MGWDCLCQSNVAGLEKNLIPDYPLHKQLSCIRGWGGGGGTLAYFGDAMNKHFWCLWIMMYWETALWIIIKVWCTTWKVTCQNHWLCTPTLDFRFFPDFQIFYSYPLFTKYKDQLKKYIKDRFKKLNHYLCQTTVTSTWWFVLTSFLSLLM